MLDSATLRLGAFLLISYCGCAQPPDAEIEIAAGRIQRARAAEAAVFAPEILAEAEAALEEARRLTVEENYRGAIQALGRAVARADAARELAVAERTNATQRLERCLRELEGLIAIARSRGAERDAPDTLAAFAERFRGVQAIAAGGDVLAALEQAQRLKPELLAFEQGFRE